MNSTSEPASGARPGPSLEARVTSIVLGWWWGPLWLLAGVAFTVAAIALAADHDGASVPYAMLSAGFVVASAILVAARRVPRT